MTTTGKTTKKPAPAPPSGQLTKRQKAILTSISQSMAKRGYAPSMREIAAKVKLLSPSTVKYHLARLEQMGYLRRDPMLPRAIQLVHPPTGIDHPKGHPTNESPNPTRLVPLVGRIAAGTPILAEQMVDGLYPFPSELVGSGELFALTVHGDSMTEAGIFDNDMVVVRQQLTAENGQIVAALVGEEATCKVWQAKGNKVKLMPCNPAYPPIDGEGAQILGRVVTVVRSL